MSRLMTVVLAKARATPEFLERVKKAAVACREAALRMDKDPLKADFAFYLRLKADLFEAFLEDAAKEDA